MTTNCHNSFHINQVYVHAPHTRRALINKISFTPHISHYHIARPLELKTKAIRRFGKISQSRRRPLLGPSPGWKHLLGLSTFKTLLRHQDLEIFANLTFAQSSSSKQLYWSSFCHQITMDTVTMCRVFLWRSGQRRGGVMRVNQREEF